MTAVTSAPPVRNRLSISVRTLFLAIVLVVCLLPLLWTVLAAFGVKPIDSVSPPTWTLPASLDHIEEIGIAEPQFVSELLTSASLALATTLLTSGIAFLAAYALARSRFRGRKMLVQSCLILASLPVISYLIPLRNTLDMLRLGDTFIGAVLSETALVAPLAMYVLFGYFNGMPIELEEAAHLDGASVGQTVQRVVLPASTVGVAATAIIIFVLSWNQVLMPMVLTTRVRTIPVAMIDFFTFERDLEWPTAAAALLASLLPIGVFVAVAYRALEQFSLGVSSNIDD